MGQPPHPSTGSCGPGALPCRARPRRTMGTLVLRHTLFTLGCCLRACHVRPAPLPQLADHTRTEEGSELAVGGPWEGLDAGVPGCHVPRSCTLGVAWHGMARGHGRNVARGTRWAPRACFSQGQPVGRPGWVRSPVGRPGRPVAGTGLAGLSFRFATAGGVKAFAQQCGGAVGAGPHGICVACS